MVPVVAPNRLNLSTHVISTSMLSLLAKYSTVFWSQATTGSFFFFSITSGFFSVTSGEIFFLKNISSPLLKAPCGLNSRSREVTRPGARGGCILPQSRSGITPEQVGVAHAGWGGKMVVDGRVPPAHGRGESGSRAGSQTGAVGCVRWGPGYADGAGAPALDARRGLPSRHLLFRFSGQVLRSASKQEGRDMARNEGEALGEARAEEAEAIAKAKANIQDAVKLALSHIEKCYGNVEAARKLWHEAFEQAVEIADNVGR